MNRKLVWLNVVLAAVVVYGGMQFRADYRAEKAREAALKAKRIAPLPAPAFTPLPKRRSGAALGLQLRGAEESVPPVARSQCAGGIAAGAAASAAHAGRCRNSTAR